MTPLEKRKKACQNPRNLQVEGKFVSLECVCSSFVSEVNMWRKTFGGFCCWQVLDRSASNLIAKAKVPQK